MECEGAFLNKEVEVKAVSETVKISGHLLQPRKMSRDAMRADG